MSRQQQLILRTAYIAAAGFLLGAAAMWSASFFSGPSSREIASSAPLKKPLMMGKSLALVQVSVRAPNGIPDHESQEVTLVGWVYLAQNIPQDLQYKWELPEGVSVVDGVAEDSWHGMKEGETAETRITVTGFSKESLKLIALHGYVKDGEAEVGNSAVLTSRPDDSFEMLGASAVAAGVNREPAAANARPLLKGKILR